MLPFRPCTALTHLIWNLLTVAGLGLLFVVATWDNITLNEVLFHLRAPMQGFDKGLAARFCWFVCIPLLLFNALSFFKYKFHFPLSIVFFAGMAAWFAVRLHVLDYFRYRNELSLFVEQHYVDPDNLEIVFERKRNLIHIYLESIEISFADPGNGGLFADNLIPELTHLAREHIDFSGPEQVLNGSYSPSAAKATMGGSPGRVWACLPSSPYESPLGMRKRITIRD